MSLKALPLHGREEWQMYLHTNRKNKSPSCCHVPPAVRIAYGVISARTGGPYSCGSLCSTASSGGLGPEMEPCTVSLEEGGHLAASQGTPTAARHRFRAAKVVMETVTPALGEERSRSSSTESWNSGNGEVSDIPSFWQESVLFQKEDRQKHSCFWQ